MSANAPPSPTAATAAKRSAAPRRADYLRAARCEKPDRLPLRAVINAACWAHYPQAALEDLMASHPALFPDYRPLPAPYRPPYALEARADQPFRDEWGCRWETSENGLMGTVVEHPLADWDALARFVPPDPDRTSGRGPSDWAQIEADLTRARARGALTGGGLRHGHTFLTLCDLRGYENILIDMADDEPRLRQLLQLVETFNRARIERYLRCGVDLVSYPEDLGMQNGPMLSPGHFRAFIQPSYRRLMAPARAAGALVHVHCDGDVRALADDLLACGVDILNVQDLVNGLDWLERRLKGRVCIELDLDRQQITVRGSPRQIDAHVRQAVRQLGGRAGGLMLCYGLYPGTPLANARAVMDAMETYAEYWS